MYNGGEMIVINEPDKVALEMAVSLIKTDLITINDLPLELANTVANVYYNYIIFMELHKITKQEGKLPEALMNYSGNIKTKMRKYIEDSAKIQVYMEATPKFINGLRQIDKSGKPNLYHYTVEYILDSLKYNIKNINHKTGLRRAIERRFKKVNEIDDLVHLFYPHF